MLFKEFTRTSFLDLLAGRSQEGLFSPVLSSVSSLYPTKDGSFWGVFDDETDSLPDALIVGDDEIEEFFAWSLTFVRDFFPLTSFFRVVQWHNRMIYSRGRNSSFERILAPSVGCILGETVAYQRGPVDSLSLSAFTSTVSFALSKLLMNETNDDQLTQVFRGVYTVRDLGRNQERSAADFGLLTAFRVLHNLLAEATAIPDKSIVGTLTAACMELVNFGRLTSIFVSERGRLMVPHPFQNSTSVPKDEQVKYFMEATGDLQQFDPEVASFLAGYMLSLISSGPMSHYELLLPLSNRYPSALIWYGICNGILFPGYLLSWSDGLGRRISRDVIAVEPVLSRPTADISLFEYLILLRSQGKSRAIRQSNPNTLLVEVFPGITTQTRIGARRDSASPDNVVALDSPLSRDILQLQRSVKELSDIIYSLRHEIDAETGKESLKLKKKRH